MKEVNYLKVVTILGSSLQGPYPGGVLALYMMTGGEGGGGDGASYCEPKKYMSLKFYTQRNTCHQNFVPKKYKT